MFEQLKELLVNELSVNADDITMDAELVSDLGINSLELADFVLLCEERFGVSISDDDIHKFITVGDVVNYDTVCQIQENLTELIEEHKEEPQPFKLQKSDVKKLLQNSGIKEEKLENFEQVYEETAGEDAFFQAANLVEAKSVAVKTPDVTIKVSPQRMDLVQIQLVEGRRCIVIPMEDGVQINGMNVTMEGTNGTD